MIDLVSAFGLGLIAYKLIEMNYPDSVGSTDDVKNDSDSNSDSGLKPIPISQYRIEKEWSNDDDTVCVYSLHFDTFKDDGSLESTYFYGYIIGNYSGTSFVRSGTYVSGTHAFKLNGKSFTNVLVFPSLSEAIVEAEPDEPTPDSPQKEPDSNDDSGGMGYVSPDYSSGLGQGGYRSSGVF